MDHSIYLYYRTYQKRFQQLQHQFLLKILLLVFVVFSVSTNSKAQYSETFSTPNKGYLPNCVNDLTGVNWLLSAWDPSGTCQIMPPNPTTDLRDPLDSFKTNASGVLISNDLDQEVYWESPEMNISAAGTVSLSVPLTWAGFDVDAAGNNCIGDYIRVYYSVNGGSFTMIPNQVGGNPCATIAYPLGAAGAPFTSSHTVTQGGISGNTLKIRVGVFTNANAEVVTIDNVSVPQAGVTIGCAAAVIATSTTQAGSCNSANGSITVTATGATPPYNVAWSGPSSGNPGGTEIASSGGTYTITPLATGAYTISVTDAMSCVSTTMVSVTTAAALSPSTQVLNVSCPGFTDGEIDLIVAGGVPPFTYSWSNLPGSGDPQDQINLGVGTYNVTVNDNAGCSANTSGTIGTQVLAAYNEQFNVANKGYLANYVDDFVGVNWTMTSWANQPPAAFGREADEFFRTSGGVLVGEDFDQDLCWTSPVISRNTATQFTVNLAWTGFDVQVDEYINVKYSIDGGAYVTVPNVVGGGAGTIQYAAGLDQNGSTLVTVTGLIGSTLQIQICAQFNANLESMTIDNVSVPNSLSAVCPSCTMTASITTNTTVSCNGGSNGSLTVTASSGTANYAYAWSNGASTSNSPSNTNTVSGLIAGSYTVTVTDGSGCTASTSVMVTQPSAIVPTATVTSNYNGAQITCFGATNGSLMASATGGVGGYTYLWSNGTSIANNTNLAAGSYTVTVTDANGCTATTSAALIQPAVINPSAAVTSNYNGAQISCYGGSDGQINTSASGGTGSYTYLWSNGAITANITSISAGTYGVTVTDANGCTGTGSVTIMQPSAVLPTTSVTNVSCFGGSNGSIDLTVSGGSSGYSYMWSTGSTSQDISSLSAGTYTVTVTDANGCSAITSAMVTQPLTANYTFIGPGSDFSVSMNWLGGCIPPLNTPGTLITINSGQTLNLSGNLTANIINNGTLTGNVNLTGDLTNNGTVSPGN